MSYRFFRHSSFSDARVSWRKDSCRLSVFKTSLDEIVGVAVFEVRTSKRDVYISVMQTTVCVTARTVKNAGLFEICPGLTLIRCTRISINVTKCLLALLPNFNITRFSEYRQLMSQSVLQMLLLK